MNDFPPALIQLPTPISFNHFIQPANLTNVSDASHLGGLVVVAAGTGRNKLDVPIPDGLLRYANFLTLSSELCVRNMLYEMNPNAIICAGVNFANKNQSIYKGDSGIYCSINNLDCSKAHCSLFL